MATDGDTPAARSEFGSTHWSLITSAARNSSPDCRRALAELCEFYWQPLYVYARRQVRDVHLAQDLTQGFFAKLLEKGYIEQARRDRGRFRAFLLGCFKHYMANEWGRANAKKRGGGKTPFPMDFVASENRTARQLCETDTPEQLNVDARYGSIRVEILADDGKPIDGFTKNDCDPITGDLLRRVTSWSGASDLRHLQGKTIGLKFYMQRSRLYSFVFGKEG